MLLAVTVLHSYVDSSKRSIKKQIIHLKLFYEFYNNLLSINPIPVGLFLSNIGWGGSGFHPTMVSWYIMHKHCCNSHGYSQLYEPDPMEKDLSHWDLYRGVMENSMFHTFKHNMEHHQL